MKKTFNKKKKIGILLIVLGILVIIPAIYLQINNITEENLAADASSHTAQILLDKIINKTNTDNKPTEIPNPTGNIEFPTASPTIPFEHTPSLTPSEETSVTPTDEATPKPVTNPSEPPTIEIDGEKYIGVLNIPALNLQLPVNDICSSLKLKKSPCRFTGSVLDNNLTVAAHNYKKHFSRIYTLKIGDIITFIDTNGVEYIYNVSEIETVDPSQSYTVIKSGFDLTLCTCTYSGNARVVVKCTRQ